MTVGKPGDKFEQEADKTADNVMRMATPAAGAEKLQRLADDTVRKRAEEKILRAAASEDKIQKAPADEQRIQRREEEKKSFAPPSLRTRSRRRKDHIAPKRRILRATDEKLQRDAAAGGGAPTVSGNVQSAIHGETTGGQPLLPSVRGFMEPRFGADFSNVRVHHDAESASLNNQLSARAFTYQNHVFFARDQYQPGTSEGKQLLAHELTHTIQQGHSVQRSPQISTTRRNTGGAAPRHPGRARLLRRQGLQHSGLPDADDRAGLQPHQHALDGRNAANLLRALIELMPGGAFITQALDNHGVINKAAAWVEQKLADARRHRRRDRRAVLKRFLDSLSWTDIFDLGGVWDRAKRIFTEPIDRLICLRQLGRHRNPQDGEGRHPAAAGRAGAGHARLRSAQARSWARIRSPASPCRARPKP